MALFCYGRLGARSVLSTIGRIPTALNSAQFAQAAAAVPKISIKKFEPENIEHHDIRNERMKRPLSPHLTIYKYELTMNLSITHRAAGIILSCYATTLGIGALVLPYDVSYYVSLVESLNLSPVTLLFLKALIAAPFGYHLANGVRHLYWDTARGLTIKEVYSTGYLMLSVATVITLFLASL